jgi:hypothetical protein
MAIEIERKFLIANDGWKNSVVRRVRIRDGLIANNKGHKARVRIADDVGVNCRHRPATALTAFSSSIRQRATSHAAATASMKTRATRRK